MKKIVTFGLFLSTLHLAAQSDVSVAMDFHIEKEVIPAMLDVVPGTLKFVDQDNNGVIDANASILCMRENIVVNYL